MMSICTCGINNYGQYITHTLLHKQYTRKWVIIYDATTDQANSIYIIHGNRDSGRCVEKAYFYTQKRGQSYKKRQIRKKYGTRQRHRSTARLYNQHNGTTDKHIKLSKALFPPHIFMYIYCLFEVFSKVNKNIA